MIPQTFIDEVQARTDIVELISGYLSLRKAGRNFRGLCPFHTEKTPSFMVSPDKQIFHCFGCGQGGGVFQFLTLIEKISFPEAVEMLAKRVGLVIPYQNESVLKEKTTLYDAVNAAATFFHHNLKSDKKYQSILQYLAKRGVGPEAIDKFKLGFAPAGNVLLNHLRKSGFTLQVLEKTSLVTASKSGFVDVFRDRIIFPIFDVRSRVIAFGGRTYTNDAQSPKYINSLENALYSKRNHLFGLNLAKDDILKQQAVIVVEGYLDMITPFMSGVNNVVASLGTALTEEQIRLLKRYCPKVILAYDSDQAGQNASLRSLDLLIEQGLETKVAKLPQGYDPDSLVREKGKDSFLKLINESLDFFDYKLSMLNSIYRKETIEGKTKTAKEMLETIDKLPSEIQKYEYIRKLALNLNVKEEIMIAEFQKRVSARNSSQKKRFSESRGAEIHEILAHEPLPVTEKVILKFILTNPKVFSLVKKNLKPEYFTNHFSRKAISFFFDKYAESGKFLPPQLVFSEADKEISGFLSRILIDDDIPLDKNMFKESLLKLRGKRDSYKKSELREQIRDAESRGDKKRAKELIAEYGKFKREVKNA